MSVDILQDLNELRTEILRDTVADMLDETKTPLDNLSPMTVCLVPTDSGLKVYMLNNEKEWKEI